MTAQDHYETQLYLARLQEENRRLRAALRGAAEELFSASRTLTSNGSIQNGQITLEASAAARIALSTESADLTDLIRDREASRGREVNPRNALAAEDALLVEIRRGDSQA